jgi:cytochrome c-type biogenesis protein CcmH
MIVRSTPPQPTRLVGEQGPLGRPGPPVLDDSLAMSPSARISALKEVSVEARISKTGLAKPESGDLISSAQIVKVGTGNVIIAIDQIRP